MEIKQDFEIKDIQASNYIIVAPAHLYVRGIVNGDITVEKGAFLTIYGTLNGNISNWGNTRVFGTVNGNVLNNEGRLTIDPNARVQPN